MSITKTREFFSLPNVHYAEFYSTAMNLISTDSILIDKGMYFYSDVVESGVLYTVLRQKDGSFMIVAFNPATHKITTTDGDTPVKGR